MKDNRKANDIKEKMKKKKKIDPISFLHDIPREKPWIHDIRRRLFILKQNINREEW